MTTVTLVVGLDGRVKIPGTKAGQHVTIQIQPVASEREAAALSPDEKERIKQEVLEIGRRARADACPEDIKRALNHGDWLYGPDGLPR